MRYVPLSLLLVVCAYFAIQPSHGREKGARTAILVSWTSEIDLKLRSRAPRHGFIDSTEELKKLWAAWRPKEEVPHVNFSQAVLLIAVGSDPNSINIEPRLHPDGNLAFSVSSTLVGYEGHTTCTYVVSLISRIDVKTIKGRALKG